MSIFCFAPLLSNSKNMERFAFSNISANLLKDASAVIRYDSMEIKVERINLVRFKRKYAITILKEEAKELGRITEWYDNQSKINDIRGTFYDAEGKSLKSLKEKDIIDRSAFGIDYTFNSDNRLKTYAFTHHTYPYTVVFEIEKTIKTTFFLPSWDPQVESYCALETADIKISYPEDLKIREKEALLPTATQKSSTTEKGIITKNWHIENLPAFEIQPLSTAGNIITPTLIFSPSEFGFMSFNGAMDTWKDFGNFYYQLNKDRDQLPENMKLKTHELIKNDSTTIQKVQTLYQYMQENTRYVADEYGLAGWQTIDANYVCTKGYGDCKGLTNYLKSLLKEVNITAYTTLISAGTEHYKVDPEFPANYFNHVILCVPNDKDTIWVECTSTNYKAGYLGSFTENRMALVCTEAGGYLVKTPEYGKGKTFSYRTARLNYNTEAKGQTIVLENTYSGLFQDDLYDLLKTQNKEELNKVNNSKFPFPSYSVNQYDAQISGTQQLPQIREKARVEVIGIINKTDKRTFINLGWIENPMKRISQLEARTEPIVLQHSFVARDSIYLYFPENLKVESLPKDIKMDYPFALFNCNFHKEKDHLLLVREYEQKAGTYNAATYKDYQKMYAVLNAQNEQLNAVFENKTEQTDN